MRFRDKTDQLFIRFCKPPDLSDFFAAARKGAPKNCDVTRWGRFTDIKDIKKEMLKRLESHFEKWLNP